jgi:hypothetical protein
MGFTRRVVTGSAFSECCFEGVGEEQALGDGVERVGRGGGEARGGRVGERAVFQVELFGDGGTEPGVGVLAGVFDLRTKRVEFGEALGELGAGARFTFFAEGVGDGLHFLHGILQFGVRQGGDDVVDQGALVRGDDGQKVTQEHDERRGAVVHVGEGADERYELGEGGAT